MNDITPEQAYAAALDSVATISVVSAIVNKTPFNLSTLDRNVRHLELLLAQTFWTTEDLAPLIAAVQLGKQ